MIWVAVEPQLISSDLGIRAKEPELVTNFNNKQNL